jgi:phenylalanyl-tRNA synthetase beta chain
MKIDLEWLTDFLPGAAVDPDAAAEALTHGGLPVEIIERNVNSFGDNVIDVEVTSNRGDCLSHLGVARELSALMNRELVENQKPIAESAAPASSVTSVKIDDLDLCPIYTARVIRNVKIRPSPPWMQRRLEAVGLRPINNVVDVTNYVMFELGQPLHAFDFDKLNDRRIVVRRAINGEKLVSIDGHTRTLSNEMLVIADATQPVAVAGVMGGRDSEVSDATVNVLLESARFDPLSIRRTSRTLGLRSDSSYRFERGIDRALQEQASLRAAQLIVETAGGELLSGVVSAGDTGAKAKQLSLRVTRLRQLLGVELSNEQVIQALQRLRLSPKLNGDRIDVTVPTYRLDLNIEADLIEEVARIVGYEKMPSRDESKIRVTPTDPDLATIEKIRAALIAGGYFEAVTFSFVSDALAGEFQPREAQSLPRAMHSVRKADAHLRPSILPGLLEAVRRNETNGVEGAKLFEIGSTFWIDPGGTVDERRQLALVGSSDLHELRGMIEALLGVLDKDKPVIIASDEHRGFASTAAGRIEWSGKTIGHLGKVDARVADKLGLREPVSIAELELAELLRGAQHVPQLRPLPRFPAVRRDLSFILPEMTRFADLESVVRETKPASLEQTEYVTTYRGKPLEKGTKSVTITLVFRSSAGTLTSEQVEGAVQQVVSAAHQKLGAALRT